MRIKQIKIFNNYRRFHDLTIDLGENPKRIIAFVGSNGCGKSSVFDALIYLRSAYGGQLGNTNSNLGQSYHFMSGYEDKNYESIQITFSDGRSFNEVMQAQGDVSVNNTVFSFRSSYRYNTTVDIKETRSVAPIGHNNIGASTASDIDQKMEDSYRRLLAEYNRYRDTTDSKPSEAKAHIIGELNKAIKNCLDLEITSLGDIESGRGTLYFKKPDHEKEFSFNVLSSGEKEVVDILLDLYLRKDTYNDSIFIIDEPELHINSSIQKKMMIEIDKMIGENCQILIATHSIGLLRALQDELNDKSDIIYFDEKNEWASKAYKLEPMKKTYQKWRSIFSTALDDINLLVAPKLIIYCEGRDEPNGAGEEKGFDAIIYNTIFNEEFPNTLFVSSGGNTELDQRSEIAIAIIGKALPSTKILVLKDLDMKSGKLVNETERQEYFKTNPSNHRVLKRFEIENYLFDKEVLKKYCENKNVSFSEEKYDLLGLDIKYGDIKSKCADIKKLCGVTNSISAEDFKKELATHIKPDLSIYAELKELIFDG